MRIRLLAIMAALACGALIGCGGRDSPGPTVTVTVTDTGAASSGAETSAPATSGDAPGVTDASSTGNAGGFTMPNEIGRVLQDAQDDIQRVTGDPVFITHSTDAREWGKGRHQILDRDWTVCTQNVAAGDRFDQKSDISFGVVKQDETCP